MVDPGTAYVSRDLSDRPALSGFAEDLSAFGDGWMMHAVPGSEGRTVVLSGPDSADLDVTLRRLGGAWKRISRPEFLDGGDGAP